GQDGISVGVVATPEVSVAVTVDDGSGLEAVGVGLSALGCVSVERSRAIVAVVGAAISEDSAAMGRAIGALDGIRVHMMSLSATGINLTVIVDVDQLNPAMERLHDTFFGRAKK